MAQFSAYERPRNHKNDRTIAVRNIIRDVDAQRLRRINGRALVCEVSAMSEDKTIPISVIALRADDYSPDGKNVIISLTTKYSTAERKFSVPIECFHDLIVDLQRLNAAASATSIETPVQPAVAPNPADDLNRFTIEATQYYGADATSDLDRPSLHSRTDLKIDPDRWETGANGGGAHVDVLEAPTPKS
jgi:hypothetical protein